MREKFLEIMKKLNCTDYTDLAYAICQADTLYGGNRRELSIRKLCASTDVFGSVSGAVSGELPRVQLYRVYADVALIVARKNDVDTEGLYLVNEHSEKVARLYGVSMNFRGSGYGDEEDCVKIIDTILNNLVDERDYEWAVRICKQIDEVQRIFTELGYTGFKDYVTKQLRTVDLPLSTPYFGHGDAHADVRKVAEDVLCSSVLSLYMKEMISYHAKDYSSAQLVLRFSARAFEGHLIGTTSEKQYAPSTNVYTGIPQFSHFQIKALFDSYKYYDMADLPYVCLLIIYMTYSHAKTNKFDAVKVLGKLKEVFSNGDK